jgi:O-antigen ligase
MAIVMPNAIDFWIAKLANTFNEDIKYDIGTFAFRERLIEDAIYAIRDTPLFGLGLKYPQRGIP